MSTLMPGPLVERAFDQWSNRIAIEFEDLRLTYADLKLQNNLWCSWLQHHGVAKGSRLAINLTSPLDCIACMIACARLGAVYVPIDPAVPFARKQSICDAATIDILVTDNRSGEAASLHDNHCASLPENWTAPMRPVDTGFLPEDPLAIMFTSGSTGTPKGVIFPQGGVAPLVVGPDTYLPITISDRILQVSARSFDAFVWELWGALLNGACLVLLPAHWSLAELADVFLKKQISAAFLTARLFDTLIDTVPDALRQMRMIGFGGEAGSASHVAKALDLLPGVQLINGYGPSENTTFSLSWRVKHPIDLDEPLPIGRPSAPDVAFLLDPETFKEIQGEGQGELFVGGPGLALGYTDLALTQERFVYISEFGCRLFRTGDLVRRLANGEYQFLGRLDRQVKILGARFNLFELETEIALHPDVTWVHAEFDTVFDRRELAVFYRTATGLPIPNETLKEHLERGDMKRSPSLLFYHLKEVPLKINGKVDVAAIVQSIRAAKAKSVADDELAQIWAEFLPGVEIEPDTDFFEAGGDSLAALNLLLATEQRFDLELPGDFLIHFSRFSQFKKAVFSDAKVESPFVTLNGGIGGATMLLLPWLDGSPYSFAHLLRNLPADAHIMSLDFREMRAQGLLTSLRDIRAALIDKLAALKVSEISLIGPSLGGVVALDIACDLEALGIPVRSVVLLDSFLPKSIVKIRFKEQRQELVTLTFWKQRILGSREAGASSAPSGVVGFSILRPKSWQGFMPRSPRAAKIFLLQAKKEDNITRKDRELARKDWIKFVPDIIIHEIDGAHLTVMDEYNSKSLADKIYKLLEF